MTKTNGVMKIEEIIHTEPPRLLVLFDQGQEKIVRVIADVLGQPYCVLDSLEKIDERIEHPIIGLANDRVSDAKRIRNTRRTVITTHAIDIKDLRDEDFTRFCDYEFLYTQKNFIRRDVARFLGFVLGQIKPHEDLRKKSRTLMLSTTFPDIRTALPNLDILSVGADSVELRVDLLKEPTNGGSPNTVPSLTYVGEQLMLLRQRTELPIIFTTRCTKENGRFPMDDPTLFYKYLRKAIQWGCEYVDVELWLPEDIRRSLAAEKGNSKIISAWHDFSGKWNWGCAEAEQLFRDGAVYGDIVKMIAVINYHEANFELESFRASIHSKYGNPPFSGLNMTAVGQFSRLLNRVFTPVTHPLLPLIAAPGQISAAEINSRLHTMGQLPRLDIYAIGNVRASGQSIFFEKCLNELSLPHQLVCVERVPHGAIETFIRQLNFGGAYLNPSLPATDPYLPKLTEAATAIGQVDTIVLQADSPSTSLKADNITWKGIRATLTRECVPSAYAQRPALVLANSEAQAAPAIFALKSLDIGPIYTVGFKANGPLAAETQQFRGAEDMKNVEEPFVVISALPAEKSFVVSPLLRHYSNGRHAASRPARVFVDLSNGIRGRGDSVAIAAGLGWCAYNLADINSFIMVETIRLLVGCNVGFDFVRLASGRSLYA